MEQVVNIEPFVSYLENIPFNKLINLLLGVLHKTTPLRCSVQNVVSSF